MTFVGAFPGRESRSASVVKVFVHRARSPGFNTGSYHNDLRDISCFQVKAWLNLQNNHTQPTCQGQQSLILHFLIFHCDLNQQKTIWMPINCRIFLKDFYKSLNENFPEKLKLAIWGTNFAPKSKSQMNVQIDGWRTNKSLRGALLR